MPISRAVNKAPRAEKGGGSSLCFPLRCSSASWGVFLSLRSETWINSSWRNSSHNHFKAFLFWPLMMISRTWVRSIILVSMSMMSGCSLAPLMNSSSVSSPERRRFFFLRHTASFLWTILLIFTFSFDVNSLVYEIHNLVWRDVITSGDVLNSLEFQHMGRSCKIKLIFIVNKA